MISMNLQTFGGRGGGSGMSSSTSGGSFMSNQRNMEDYAIATGALDVGSEEETRAFLRTADGRAALNEFMEGEREAGLTESEMREAIQATGSNRSASTPTPGLVDNSDFLKSQVQKARRDGYKSPQVNEMVREATNAGWKETYPSGGGANTNTPLYRSMQTRGTGALSERRARVTATERGINLHVDDGYMGSEYHFSNVSDAIRSGNKFVSNRRASTRRGGPKDSEFLTGSGRPR